MTDGRSDLGILFDFWAARDARYAMRRSGGHGIPLTDAEIDSIRTYRKRETMDLEGSDKRLAEMALSRWAPPIVLR